MAGEDVVSDCPTAIPPVPPGTCRRPHSFLRQCDARPGNEKDWNGRPSLKHLQSGPAYLSGSRSHSPAPKSPGEDSVVEGAGLDAPPALKERFSEMQDYMERLLTEGKLVEIIDKTDVQAAPPFQCQVDTSMYTTEALKQRLAIKKHFDIWSRILHWWDTLPKNTVHHVHYITKRTYLRVFGLIQQQLQPLQEYTRQQRLEVLPHPLIHSSTHPLIHSSTHPIIHSSTHPLTHSSTHPLIHSSTQSLIHSSTHPLIYAYTHTRTHSSTHPLIHSSTHPASTQPLIHPSTHQLINSSMHPLIHASTHPLICTSTHTRIHSTTPRSSTHTHTSTHPHTHINSSTHPLIRTSSHTLTHSSTHP
eukprot:NODE_598_length_1513_cov_89.963798_g440_i0.p1 GENE.NODE_598_length_1513_cov_89.963798_g440_i0~~NODE_598_length_1513_cov_89.963798_g440_i0.p1  ORF type:complete len:360 (-),score=84.07 NODE_598_length_1513_cov_89.963798_g440_i0:206-1285(-)